MNQSNEAIQIFNEGLEFLKGNLACVMELATNIVYVTSPWE